jgi:hypothetical protein
LRIVGTDMERTHMPEAESVLAAKRSIALREPARRSGRQALLRARACPHERRAP